MGSTGILEHSAPFGLCRMTSAELISVPANMFTMIPRVLEQRADPPSYLASYLEWATSIGQANSPLPLEGGAALGSAVNAGQLATRIFGRVGGRWRWFC